MVLGIGVIEIVGGDQVDRGRIVLATLDGKVRRGIVLLDVRLEFLDGALGASVEGPELFCTHPVSPP
jgi:hypothetical protein